VNDSTTVDPRNLDQARAWDGSEGEFWAAEAERFERSAAAYDQPILEAAQLTEDADVLDVGCGSGATTRAAALAAPAGTALGVDLSRRLVEVARKRAAEAGVANARFLQADAQVHPFHPGSMDAVVSRTGAMFFGDPAVAFANLGQALRTGGRLALVAWAERERNEWINLIAGALLAGRPMPAPPADAPGPFSLSDPARTHDVLATAGFSNITCTRVEHPIWFGADADEAVPFVLGVVGWMLDGLDPAARDDAVADLRSRLAEHRTADGVLLGSAAWLVVAARDSRR
jgi:SAM-dependent methyltransferase